MYLSCLLIDVGTDPDRPRPGRLWLRNRYRIHQRLCMAFPSAERKDEDPSMLQPFAPEQFAGGDVHVERDGHAGFLYRIDPQPGGRVIIVVFSARKPEWEYAFRNAAYLLAAPPSAPRPVEVRIAVGSRFRFRLAANPVFRVREASVDRRGEPFDAKWVGKRIPVPADEKSLRNWLERRATRNGFTLEDVPFMQAGYAYVNKTRKTANCRRLRSVRYEGILKVTDPDRFRCALATGIGPAKAFGFGLLSIAPTNG